MNPLFQGTLSFVQMEFVVSPEKRSFSVSATDMNTVVQFATRAAVPISLYARQYGENSISVNQNLIPYKVTLPSRFIDDASLQGWAKDIASKLPKPSCVVVMLPPEIDNSSESRSKGVGGYHGSVNGTSYINSYINNDREGSTLLTVQDKTFRYSGALSHEMAEMVADPLGGNPEVCDPCGPNYVSTYLNYFDGEGNYITTTQTPPYEVTFPYDFYINGIVQPAYAKPAAAPAAACSYSPVPTGISVLSQIAGAFRCDGFFTDDDRYRHAIVGSRDGHISEVFYSPTTGHGVAPLAQMPGLADVAGFFTPDDSQRHVLALTGDGNIHEIFYNPKTGKGQSVIGTIQNAQHVAGFYSDDDRYRHAIVAAADGSITEVFYHPKHGSGRSRLGTFQNVVDVGCFYSADDHYRHAIVATADGSIVELFYHPQKGSGQTVIANVPGVKSVTAYYVPTDLYSRRIQAADAGGAVYEFRFHPNYGKLKVRLAHPGSVLDLGGFYSADDQVRHAILLDPQGNVRELFYDI